MKRFVAAAVILACSASAAPVLAANAGENTVTLDKVVVTAGRIEENAKNVTQSVTVISREEIAKNQYQDMGQLLRNYGVQANSYAPNESFSQIAIRGMRTPLFGEDVNSPVLILVDGRRAGTTNISIIPMVGIERIEIVRGPASVQYGASAVGGVVNIITKRGGDDLKISAEAGMGSWETWKAQAALTGSYGALDFAGGVSSATVNRDYKTGHGHTYKNTQMNHSTSYILNTGLTFLEEHRVGVSLLGMRSEKMGNPNTLDDNTLTPKTDRYNHSVDTVYDGGTKEYGLSWKARYFNVSDRYLWEDPQVDLSRSKTKANTQGSQAQITWTKDSLTLTGGLDWTNNDYRNVGSKKSEYDNIGGFLLAKAGLFEEKLILSAGVRYDDYTLKYDGKEKGLDNASPSFGLAWHALDWLTFRGNYGESYRIPGAQEMTGYELNGWYGKTVYHGNSNLDPEKGKGWDIGVEFDYKAFNLNVTYFQIDYENKIATRSYGSGSDMQYYNISGKTKYRGLEGQASLDIGEIFEWPFMLRLYGNITHMLRYEDEHGNKLENVSNTDLGYGLNFQYPAYGLEADLRFIYFGHQKEKDWSDWTNPKEVKTGGKTTADFFISKTIWNWEDAGTVSIKGEVRNIFDENYSTIYGYPMPGRSFYLGLRYDY